MTATELSLDAASQADITKAAIAKAIAHRAKSGGKLTQEAIAKAADVTQGWVSRFFTNMGGWAVWRQIITSLLRASNRASNNFDSAMEPLTDDERWIAQEYLSLLVVEFEADPVGVAEAVTAIALGYGAEAWRRIVGAAGRGVVAQLLGQVLSVVPEWVAIGVSSVGLVKQTSSLSSYSEVKANFPQLETQHNLSDDG